MSFVFPSLELFTKLRCLVASEPQLYPVSPSHPQNLPHELLEAILSQVYDLRHWRTSTGYEGHPVDPHGQSAFLSLLRVCKDWYFAGVAILYAESFIPSSKALARFARTVTLRSDLANLVRTVVLKLDEKMDPANRAPARGLVDYLQLGESDQELLRRDSQQWVTETFYEIISACPNIHALLLPPLRDFNRAATDPLIQRRVVRLRRLALLGAWGRSSDPVAFGAAGSCLSSPSCIESISPPTIVDLDLQCLEELNLGGLHAILMWSLPPLPSVRTLHITHACVTTLAEPWSAVPLFGRLHNLEVIYLRENLGVNLGDGLFPSINCIQSNAATMTELSLVGATELVIARRLDLKAFTSLRCLTLGYITPAESPSDFVSIPDSLQTLIVRWSNRRPKPTYSKTGYFFRSIEAMCNHLRNSEEMSISKRQEALLFVEMFDLSSLEAILLCQERDARLVYVELDQERGPVLLESFKDDQPLHSTLSLAFLPFKWAIVLVS